MIFCQYFLEKRLPPPAGQLRPPVIVAGRLYGSLAKIRVSYELTPAVLKQHRTPADFPTHFAGLCSAPLKAASSALRAGALFYRKRKGQTMRLNTHNDALKLTNQTRCAIKIFFANINLIFIGILLINSIITRTCPLRSSWS